MLPCNEAWSRDTGVFYFENAIQNKRNIFKLMNHGGGQLSLMCSRDCNSTTTLPSCFTLRATWNIDGVDFIVTCLQPMPHFSSDLLRCFKWSTHYCCDSLLNHAPGIALRKHSARCSPVFALVSRETEGGGEVSISNCKKILHYK